ncbi:MAG TPA: hypothetical protein VH110_04015 [Candidatus Acidoferrum sp.]|nr:hypothetical protein [Candidatus Acidoferrum sp.]
MKRLLSFGNAGARCYLFAPARLWRRLRELMRKYSDRPMDLADAALLRVAEREGFRKIFTVDRRDFAVYRLRGRTRLTLIP